MTKAFVTESGVYLFSFDGDVECPEGAQAVPSAPEDARQIWDFTSLTWKSTPAALSDYEDAIQVLVDQTAQDRLFRDGVTLASYVASTNPQWAGEAQAFVAWRDQVWAYAYEQLARVNNSDRPVPRVAEFLAELPVIAWP